MSKTQNYRNPFPTVRKLFTILSAVFAAALFLPEAYASSVNENERADSTAVVREDSVFIFRFKNRTNMFFMHFGGNEDVIRRAAEMIDRNREALKRGDMYLAIHGYCSSFVSEYSNMAMASNRSNQVKSYYITNHGLREDNYCTYNHAVPYNGDKDVVTTMQLIAVRPTPPIAENQLKIKILSQIRPNPSIPLTIRRLSRPKRPITKRNKYLPTLPTSLNRRAIRKAAKPVTRLRPSVRRPLRMTVARRLRPPKTLQ